jgi:hypothetical protein
LQSVCTDINAAIHNLHGVKCFSDDNTTNNCINNYYVLHIYDILNVMVHNLNGTVPKVGITTYTLQSMLGTSTANLFEKMYLKEGISLF